MENSSSKEKTQPTVGLVRRSLYEEQKKKKQKTVANAMEKEVVPLSVDVPPSDVDNPESDAEEVDNDLKPSGDAEQEEVIPVDSEDESENEPVHIPAEPVGNNIDDLAILASWIVTKPGNDKNCKKVHEMIYLMLQVIAVDIVYATEKVKTYDLCLRLANEMDLVVCNVHTATSKIYYRDFLRHLPRGELPVEVVKLHDDIRTTKFTEAQINKIPAKDRKCRKEEEHVAYLCGSKFYDNAMKARQEISSKFATKWRQLNSGETRNGLLYAIRRSLYEAEKEDRIKKACVNAITYKQKKTKLPLTEEEKDDICKAVNTKLGQEVMGDWYPKKSG